MLSVEGKPFLFKALKPTTPNKHPRGKKIPKKTVVIASTFWALHTKSSWHSQSWEEQQQGCASGKMKPISGFNFQKEMPCLFHVSFCSDQNKTGKKMNKAKTVGLAGYSQAEQRRADGKPFCWLEPCLVWASPPPVTQEIAEHTSLLLNEI